MKENFIRQMTVSPSWTQTSFEPPIWRLPLHERRNPANTELQQLKTRLLRPFLEKTEQPDLCHQLQLAANEALADAMKRPSPFQVLPCLLETKVREVQQWFQRQQRIREVTRTLFQTWSDGVEGCWNFGSARINSSFH